MHGATIKMTVGNFCGVHPIVTYRANSDILVPTAVNINKVLLVSSQPATCFGHVDQTQALKYTTLKLKIRLKKRFGF